MDLIISLLMGSRLLALFGGGLGGETTPVFLEPRIIIAADEIRLTCSLANAFPPELKKLAETATPVVIYVIVTVSERDARRTIKKVTAESRLVYDMIARRYCVSRSVTSDTVCFFALDSAVAAAVAFPAIPVIARGKINKGSSYVFSVQAILGKTRVEALDNKEIDCMYYWNYKRPGLTTEAVSGAQLTGKGRH
ncbi:MAG: DUF4390 domain-containing protein [Chitinispirillaceae bacterium]|nr:DUF4390 domain-containing protein [Chitinispirillaceae bacterium]